MLSVLPTSADALPTFADFCLVPPTSVHLRRLRVFPCFTSESHGAICTAVRKRVSMQKDYRLCLEKLAGTIPKRKAALIRSLLPGIEAALNSGQSLNRLRKKSVARSLLTVHEKQGVAESTSYETPQRSNCSVFDFFRSLLRPFSVVGMASRPFSTRDSRIGCSE